ncbi:MAG: hypothetical protein J7K26_00550 [Candidatus Aenigmarchaeota archaeon]|nr:hypothetical protein [Candidatus Aenigmarchaeota archaeon]
MAKPKTKTWFEIKAPKLFKSISLGETPALEAKDIIGRVVDTSLIELDNKTKKYYVKLFFKINNVDSNKANTVFIGHECMRDFLSRVIRTGGTRIDVNDIFELKDSKLRVKIVIMTRGRVSISVNKKIRKKTKELLESELKTLTLDEFIKSFIENKIQSKIIEEIKKIYPIKVLEINKTNVL